MTNQDYLVMALCVIVLILLIKWIHAEKQVKKLIGLSEEFVKLLRQYDEWRTEMQEPYTFTSTSTLTSHICIKCGKVHQVWDGGNPDICSRCSSSNDA